MPLVPKKVKLVNISDFTKFADSLARSLRANLGWSKKLRRAVKLHRATESGGEVSAYVTIGEGNDGLAGMAKAYEYGSGLHATRGTRAKYQIRPKNKKALWFPYPQSKVWKGVTYYKGGITTGLVMHPGVEARPYLGKSITSTLQKASPELRVAIERNIIEYLRIELKDLSR